MSYIALYRQWRPLVFDDVVGQDHIVKTLKNSVSSGRVAHAYLFSGMRGTGKTTTAKILARAVNCLSPKNGEPCNECEICSGILTGAILDVIEIDAASNNSVDNVRDIRDEVNYCPSKAKYKVYIIDEVHMLSAGAFNALLKTLEEPPAHVMFILATTEPHKLPATILSRCQRYDFRKVSGEDIVKRLEKIALQNNVKLEKEALKLVARLSDGSVRDAVSLLDQCISLGKNDISYGDVIRLAGVVEDESISQIADCIRASDVGKLLNIVGAAVACGKDIARLLSDLILYYRDMLVYCVSGSTAGLAAIGEEVVEKLKTQAGEYGRDRIIGIIEELSSIAPEIRWAAQPRVLLEVTLIKICSSFGTNGANRLQTHNSEKKSDEKKKGNSQAEPLKSGGVPAKAANMPETADAPTEAANMPETADAPAEAADAPEFAGIPETVDVPKAAGTPEVKTETGETVLDKWDEVLQSLKKSGRMVLYTNLLKARAVVLSENQVGVVFKPEDSMKRTMVSRAENLEVLHSVISGIAGKSMRVKCMEEEEEKMERKPADFVEKVMGYTEKLNIPVNILDD